MMNLELLPARVRRIVITSITGLLAFCSCTGYAQYNTTQIDSILDAANYIDNLEQGIKAGLIAYNASKTINYQEGMVRGLLTCAVQYNNTKQYENAFEYMVKAEGQARKLNNPRYLTLVAVLKGMAYTNLGFYRDGKETLLNAIPIAQDIQDADQRHNRMGAIYAALAENSQLSKDSSKTLLQYVKKSYRECSIIKIKNKFNYVVALPATNLGSVFLDLKQYDSAEFYLKKSILLADQYHIERAAKAGAFLSLGDLYYQKKNYQQSETNYKNAITMYTEMKNGPRIKDGCVGLSKVYMALGENVNAQKYLQRGIELADSLSSVEKSSIKTPLGYILKYKEQQLVANKTNYVRIIVLTCLLLILCLISLFFYRLRAKRKIQFVEAKMNELVKQMELTSDSHAPLKIDQLKEVVQLAVNNNPAFLTQFNDYCPEFGKKLLEAAPGLVVSEIEFCAMLRLNFETKEIARYTKLSVRAVEGKKYRIRKKLNIPSETDINLWMSHV